MRQEVILRKERYTFSSFLVASICKSFVVRHFPKASKAEHIKVICSDREFKDAIPITIKYNKANELRYTTSQNPKATVKGFLFNSTQRELQAFADPNNETVVYVRIDAVK